MPTAFVGLPRRAIALAVLCVTGCTDQVSQESWAPTVKKNWTLSVKVSGELRASHSDAIGPPQIAEGGQYKIARMVAEGTKVKKGDEVVAFDTSELEERLRQRRNDLDLATAEIERRRSDAAIRRRDDELAIAESRGAERKAGLKAQGASDLFSSLELQTARLDHELAELRLKYRKDRANVAENQDRDDLLALRGKRRRAQERVAQIEGFIKRMSVRAPRNSTVIYLPNGQGQKKKVGDGVWRGENILRTASTSQMLAEGEVAETEIGRVALRQRATIRLEAHPDAEYSGKVQAIGKLVEPPSDGSPLRIAKVDIELDKTDPLSMRPGMRFTGKIEIETVPDALLVPLRAVFVRGEGPVAHVKTPRGFRTVPLRLGRAHRGQVRVVEGLSEGDEVSTLDLEARETP